MLTKKEKRIKMKDKLTQVAEEAEKLKGKNRYEIIAILSKKFKLSPLTVNMYLSLIGFKSRQKNLSSLDMLKRIEERPVFSEELNVNELNLASYLMKKGLVKKYSFGDGSVFFTPQQKLVVYRMLKERLGRELRKNKRSVLLALGIPFFIKNGYYYSKETGEML